MIGLSLFIYINMYIKKSINVDIFYSTSSTYSHADISPLEMAFIDDFTCFSNKVKAGL